MERVIAIIVLVAALALVGLTFFGPRTSTSNPQVQKEAQFTLTEYAITPNRVALRSGRVKLIFNNQGNNIHQIEIYDTVIQTVIHKIDFIRQKSAVTVWLDLTGGRRYEVYDPVWRRRGMEALIITQ